MTANQYPKFEHNDKLQTSTYIYIYLVIIEAVESKTSSTLLDFAAGIQC